MAPKRKHEHISDGDDSADDQHEHMESPPPPPLPEAEEQDQQEEELALSPQQEYQDNSLMVLLQNFLEEPVAYATPYYIHGLDTPYSPPPPLSPPSSPIVAWDGESHLFIPDEPQDEIQEFTENEEDGVDSTQPPEDLNDPIIDLDPADELDYDADADEVPLQPNNDFVVFQNSQVLGTLDSQEAMDRHDFALANRYIHNQATVFQHHRRFVVREMDIPNDNTGVSHVGDLINYVDGVNLIVRNAQLEVSTQFGFALVHNLFATVRLGFYIYGWAAFSFAHVYEFKPGVFQQHRFCVRSTFAHGRTQFDHLVRFSPAFRYGIRLRNNERAYCPPNSGFVRSYESLAYAWENAVAVKCPKKYSILFQNDHQLTDSETHLPKLPKALYEQTSKFQALQVCLFMFANAGKATLVDKMSGEKREVSTFDRITPQISKFPVEIVQKILCDAGFFKVKPNGNLHFDPWEEFPVAINMNQRS